MKHLIAIVFTCFFISAVSLAQENNSKLIDQDKNKFEQNVFNQQFGEVDDTVHSAQKLFDKIPEKLPNWVLQPDSFEGKLRIVGYSDPNMEKEEAYQQALLRAKAIYALLEVATISNITDDYTNLKESGAYSLYLTKFQDFSVAKAIVPYSDSAVHIIDTFYTKYQEGIVLVEIDKVYAPEQLHDTIVVKGEHLQVFIEKNFKREKIEFFNFSVKDKLYGNDSTELTSEYNFKKVNRGYDIVSFYKNKEIEFIPRTYNYRIEGEIQPDSTYLNIKTYRLSRGLWNAYLSGILTNVTTISKQLSSQVKNSNDFYTLKSEGLIRTVARNKVAFQFVDFKLYENQIYIDLDGIILQ